MHIVIGVPIGLIVTIGLVVWFLVSVRRAEKRKRKLNALRERQEAARIRAIERSLRPPLFARAKTRLFGSKRIGDGE